MSTGKKYFLLFLLALMFSAAYLLPYIKYVFYEPLMVGLGATNKQIGFLLSVYAIMNTLTLIPGGWIADKYSAKKIIVISSIATGLLNYVLAYFMTFQVAIVVWLLLGISTIFAFWGAIIKVVRLLGNEDEQGKLYGWYASFQGIINTLAALGAAFIFGLFANQVMGLRGILIFYGSICIVGAILFQIFYPKEEKDSVNEDPIQLKDIVTVLKMPATWLLSFIIFSIYGVFSGSTYLTPYVGNVIGITGVVGSMIAIFRTYMARALFCPVGGIVADKTKQTAKTILFTSIGSALFILCLLLFGKSVSSWIVLLIIVFSAIAIYMNFGIMWAVSAELKVPRNLYGTVVGVASIIGYAPDIFMHTLFGNWLDQKGDFGYNYIFLFLIGLCLIGVITSYIIIRRTKKININTTNLSNTEQLNIS